MLVHGENSLTQVQEGVFHPSWPFGVPLRGLGDPMWPQWWVISPYTPGLQALFLPRERQQTSMNRRPVEHKVGPILICRRPLCWWFFPKPLFVLKIKSLLHTRVMLHWGQAGSRAPVSCTPLEGTRSSPSQGRSACVWVLFKTHFLLLKSCQLPHIWLQFQSGFFCNVSES